MNYCLCAPGHDALHCTGVSIAGDATCTVASDASTLTLVPETRDLSHMGTTSQEMLGFLGMPKAMKGPSLLERFLAQRD